MLTSRVNHKVIKVFFISLLCFTITLVKTSLAQTNIHTYVPSYTAADTKHNEFQSGWGTQSFSNSYINKFNGKIYHSSAAGSQFVANNYIGVIDYIYRYQFCVPKTGYYNTSFIGTIQGDYWNVSASAIFGAGMGATEFKTYADIWGASGATKTTTIYKTNLSLNYFLGQVLQIVLFNLLGIGDIVGIINTLQSSATPEKHFNQSFNYKLSSVFLQANQTYEWWFYCSSSTGSVSLGLAANLSVLDVTLQLDEVVVDYISNFGPTSIVASSSSICKGSSVNLYVSGGLGSGTWKWYSGSCAGTPEGSGNSINKSPNSTTTYYVRAENSCINSGCISKTIYVNPAPSVSAGSNKIIPCGGSTTLSPTASQGTPSYSYSWSPPIGLSCINCQYPTANPTSNTTYTVTVTDSKGCTDTDQMTITVNPGPTANAGSGQNIPCGGSTTLSPSASQGSPSYSYSWSPTTGLSCTNCQYPTASPSLTTTYTVTVTDSKGCKDSDQMTLVVNPGPIANAGSAQTIPCGGSTTLSPSASQGTPGYSYLWSPSTGLSCTNCQYPNASPSVTTTYTVIATDSKGCADSDQMTLTVNSGPNANAGSNKTIICGGSTSIGGAPTGSGGTGPYTYSWSPIAGLNDPTIPNPISSPSSSTTYTVTVTDNYGCSTSSAPVTVTINYNLVANVGSNKTIPCGGSTLIGGSPTGLGGASPLTYSWSPQAGLNDPTDPNPIASPSVTTSYTVTVMDNNGCSTSSNPVTVTINYNLLADAGQDKTIPCGGSTSIGGSPAATGGNTPYSYLWSPAAGLNNNTLSNPTASPAFTTTYILTVTDNNSCDHIDSMKVIVNPGPTADAGSNKTIACGGTTTIGGAPTGLGGISPYTYAWSPPSGLSNTAVGNPTVSMNTTTTYTVIVTDDNGCSDTSSITVLVNPGPTAEAGLDKTIGCGNSTIIGGSSTGSAGTSPYTYLWAPSGDLNSSTIANPTANPISNTTYTVIVTDDNNCTGTDTMNVQVTNLNGPFASITKTDANCGNADGTATATTSSGVPPYTYMWSTGKTTDSITNLLPGTYSVTVTDSIGCTDTASVVIYNIGNFTAQVTNSNPVICAGEITTLVASGAVTYSWYPTTGLDTSKGPVVNASPSITTTYTLVAFSGNCIDSVNVPVIVNPLPQPVISGKPAVCLNEKDAFYSTPYANNHAYSWTVTNGSIVLGQYTDKIEVNWSSAGSGSVQVEESINSTGCKVVTPVFNVLIQSYPAPGKSTITLKGNKILVCSDTSVSSYQWYYNGNKIAGATKQFYVANPFYPSGPYWVITATSNGCETRSNVYPVNNTGINEIDNVSQIVIYPNPNSQNFNVYIDNNIYGEVEILIKDYTGREFSRIRFDKTGKSIVKNISTNTLASGIYLVEIIFPDRTKYYRRMIVIN